MARPGEPMTSVKRLAAAERMVEALKLRKAGLGFQRIADELGYKSPSGAHDAVMKALKATLQEPADELRKLELERLDALLLGLWPKASRGDPRSVEVALKAMERRASYLGLDAPVEQRLMGDLTTMVQLVGVDPEAI